MVLGAIVHLYSQIYIHLHTHTHTQIHTQTHKCVHAHTPTSSCTHIRMHFSHEMGLGAVVLYDRQYICLLAHTYAHTHTHARTHTQAATRTPECIHCMHKGLGGDSLYIFDPCMFAHTHNSHNQLTTHRRIHTHKQLHTYLLIHLYSHTRTEIHRREQLYAHPNAYMQDGCAGDSPYIFANTHTH